MKEFFSKKICVLVLLLVFSCTSFVLGYWGNSNFSGMGYPKFKRTAPHVPYSDNAYVRESYKRELDEYAKDAEHYVRNCDNDMREIREAQIDVRRQVKQAYDEYNNHNDRGRRR